MQIRIATMSKIYYDSHSTIKVHLCDRKIGYEPVKKMLTMCRTKNGLRVKFSRLCLNYTFGERTYF